MLTEILQFLVQAQQVMPTPQVCDSCPASALTAIGASYATEGYYVQSDIIFQILNTDFGLWAPVLYILAAGAGFASLALGQPPRTYMWFFMGPAIYAWLIDNTSPASGVAWVIANRAQDQKQVWKLSEAGLNNVNHAAWSTFRVYSDREPDQKANVATVFLWYDEVISSTVQALTEWTGVHHQGGRGGQGTNLAQRTGQVAEGKHYLMSNLKWGMVENITDAHLHNVDARDAFVNFMASECGDKFGSSLDQASVIAVQNTKGENLTKTSSVFPAGSSGSKYQAFVNNLAHQYVPTPPSLRRFINHGQNASGSFRKFLGAQSQPVLDESIDCLRYLSLLTQAFRWESGHIFHQLVSSAPTGLTPEDIVYNLFYGWDVKMGRSQAGTGGSTLTPAQYASFLMDLILVHLYRNEMAMAPRPVDSRFASSAKAEGFVNAHARTTGSRGKYGEIYAWALMIPHIQGILLFILAAGYPVACIMIVVPGLHKTIITWAKFWMWVKMWDVGFAIVMVLERSVWAMLGNGSNSVKIFDLVTEMQSWGAVQVGCPQGQSQSGRLCPVPDVTSTTQFQFMGFGGWGIPIGQYTPQTLDNQCKTLDRAMVLAANLDLDLANSYYIYIMAALYFAVPAVTGQVILGAQAGASSMINTAIGGVAQESGKMAGSGMGSEAVTRLHANMASVGQAGYAKSLRTSGLGMQAIEYGNQSAREADGAAYMGTRSGNLDLGNDNRARTFQTAIAAGDVMNEYAKAAQTVGNNILAESRRGAAGGGGGGRKGGAAGVPANVATGGGPTSAGQTLDGSGGVGGIATGGSADTGDKADGGGAPGTRSRTSSAAPPSAAGAGLGGAAAASSGGTGGGDSQVGGKPGSGLPPWLSGVAQSLSSIAGAGVRDWTAQEQRAGLEFGAQVNAAKAELAVGSFGANSRAKAYEMAGSRMSQHAGFEAQQADWVARNQFAHQISGQAVALGHFIGGMSAGNKPTAGPEAMAMSGMLNTSRHDAKGAAFWSDPLKGERFNNIGANEGKLNREVGKQWVGDQFTSYGFTVGGQYGLGGLAKAAASSSTGKEVQSAAPAQVKGNSPQEMLDRQR